jgi:NAD(P)-dependent dehydrogenase (short-subunit alcohol dehydrogenase family)
MAAGNTLNGRVALLTGASGGIGQAVALRLAAEGAPSRSATVRAPRRPRRSRPRSSRRRSGGRDRRPSAARVGHGLPHKVQRGLAVAVAAPPRATRRGSRHHGSSGGVGGWRLAARQSASVVMTNTASTSGAATVRILVRLMGAAALGGAARTGCGAAPAHDLRRSCAGRAPGVDAATSRPARPAPGRTLLPGAGAQWVESKGTSLGHAPGRPQPSPGRLLYLPSALRQLAAAAHQPRALRRSAKFRVKPGSVRQVCIGAAPVLRVGGRYAGGRRKGSSDTRNQHGLDCSEGSGG